MPKHIVVVGAGAAGMMAAITAAQNGAHVTVLEQNEKAGKKLYITGKGRCNITNACNTEDIFRNIISNKKFMYSAIYSFDNHAVMDFFSDQGLELKTERGNRVFPVSDKSSDVIRTLIRAMEHLGISVRYHCLVNDLLLSNGIITGVVVNRNEKIMADAVIFATGGLSYPVTGSDGKAMQLLKKYGHTITECSPALVPMNTLEDYVPKLQGLSLKNVTGRFYLENKPKKPVYEEFGEMLFTHFGVSGPIVLSASSYLAKYIGKTNIKLVIDLKPALSCEQLDDRILREFKDNCNRNFNNSLDSLLPKKMIPVIIEYAKIDPYKKVHEISKEERARLVHALKEFTVTIVSFRDYKEAIITQGGISVKEINPGTMESKLMDRLFICGEMIDVDALTGGFNLQIAWSSGYLAGMNAAIEIEQDG